MAKSFSVLILALLLTVSMIAFVDGHRDDGHGDDDDNVGNDKTFGVDNQNNSRIPMRILINYGVSMLALGALSRISWLMYKRSKL